MLRWLTLGFLGLSLAVVIAACNSGDTSALNGGLGIGPDFATGTLYAANSNQNAISIYLPNPANSASPAFQIGGSNTQLNGPQYLAFDTNSNLWITNYNASTTASSIDVIKALATGNVFPIGTITSPGLGQPRGIAIYNTNSIVGVAVVNPADPSPSQLQFYTTSSNGFTLPFLVIAGNLTMLNVPSGMAFDSTGHIYVTNRADASVETFVVPTPTPTPSPTTTPSPTPTPTPPTPTPSPTATPYNVAPTTRIFGPLTGLQGPTGVTLDTASIIYVSDAGNPPGVNPSVRIFAAGATGNIAPIHIIAGSNTLLNIPTDVKVDSSGKIYIADSGTNKIYVYAAGVYGNVAPVAVLNVVGNVIGIGLAP